MMGRLKLWVLVLGIASVTASVAAGAASAASHASATTPQNVPFQTLQTWTHPWSTSCAHTCYRVISDEATLRKFWYEDISSPPIPSVDFSHYAVIAAVVGPGTNRNSIHVMRVVRVNGTVQVHVFRSWSITGVIFNGAWYAVTLVEVPLPVTHVQFIVRQDNYFCPWGLLAVCQTTPAIGWPTALVQAHPDCGRVPSTSEDQAYIPYRVVCYAPSKVKRAESLMHPHPVDPTAAVDSATGLHPRRVYDVVWTQPDPQHYVPNLIVYSYGTPPATMAATSLSRRHPTFVEIDEANIYAVGRTDAPGPLLQEGLLHIGANLNTGDKGPAIKEPWSVGAWLRPGSLWIDIFADGRRSAVRSLGLRILRALDQSKPARNRGS